MSAIREETYKIIDVMKLPKEVKNDLIDYCPSNDSAIMMTPDEDDPLGKWLIENNYPVDETYWIYYSW